MPNLKNVFTIIIHKTSFFFAYLFGLVMKCVLIGLRVDKQVETLGLHLTLLGVRFHYPSCRYIYIRYKSQVSDIGLSHCFMKRKNAKLCVTVLNIYFFLYSSLHYIIHNDCIYYHVEYTGCPDSSSAGLHFGNEKKEFKVRNLDIIYIK